MLDLGNVAWDILRVTGAHSLMDDRETGQIGEVGPNKEQWALRRYKAILDFA